MMLEGRIVGVVMSKSPQVEYTFQVERIVDVQEGENDIRYLICGQEKDGEKQYPPVRLAFPLKVGDAQNKCGNLVGISDAFSIGYLLMEHKEKILIQCELKKDPSVLRGEVDSFCIGEGAWTKGLWSLH